MDTTIHQSVQCRIDHPMALDRQLTGESGADDAHVEMALALPRVTGVLVAFVQHVQLGRRECSLQALADLGNDGLPRVHGSTLRNGLTVVSR